MTKKDKTEAKEQEAKPVKPDKGTPRTLGRGRRVFVFLLLIAGLTTIYYGLLIWAPKQGTKLPPLIIKSQPTPQPLFKAPMVLPARTVVEAVDVTVEAPASATEVIKEKVVVVEEATPAVELTIPFVSEKPAPEIIYQPVFVTPQTPALDRAQVRAEVVALRQRFMAGEPCRAELQRLIKKAELAPLTDGISEVLWPFCLNAESPLSAIRRDFVDNKKRALVAVYRAENPMWLALLKSLPLQFADIRQLNPAGNRPRDLLDKAHLALDRGDLAGAAAFVRALPYQAQAALYSFTQGVAQYQAALEQINRLINELE